MRMLVICLCLGALLIQTSANAPPNLFALIGFLLVIGLTFTRLFARLGFPDLIGALAAGILLGITTIIPPVQLPQIDHAYDFGLAWMGMFLGAGLTLTTTTNRRLVLGSLLLFFPPVLFVLVFLMVQNTPWLDALSLSVLGGISALLFLPQNSKIRGEIEPLAKLTTVLGLVFYGVLNLNLTTVFGTKPLDQIGIDVILYVTLLESAVQISRSVKTSFAKHMTMLVLAYLLGLASYTREISALFLAFPAGIYLSFRQAHTSLANAKNLSQTILSFVLTLFALKVFYDSPSHVDSARISLIGFFIVILLSGKVVGGLLAQHVLRFSAKTWLSLLPPSFVALLCLAPSSHATPLSLQTMDIVAFLVFVAAYPACTLVWSKIKKDPIARYKPSNRVF